MTTNYDPEFAIRDFWIANVDGTSKDHFRPDSTFNHPRSRHMMLSVASEYLSLNDSSGLYMTKATNQNYQVNLRAQQIVWDYEQFPARVCDGPY
jgi:hypothetical protein